MYTLLLSMYVIWHDAGGAVIHESNGYSSYESCKKAGELFKEQNARSEVVRINWTCVKK